MPNTFTDLKQLSRALLKKSPPPRVDLVPVEKPVVDEDVEVLAYFSRPSQNAPGAPRVASEAKQRDRVAEIEAALEAKDAALNVIAEEKVAADERIAELERQLTEEREAHEEAARERDRLQGECGWLQGELHKRDENGPVAASGESEPVAPAEPTEPARGILVAPVAIGEAFLGEVREQVLATLQDGLEAAKQSGRERRAEILRRVLAANEPSGELDRRRASLKQILKDAGGFADASTLAALERLGIRCISGRKHRRSLNTPMSECPCRKRRPTTVPRRTRQRTWPIGAFNAMEEHKKKEKPEKTPEDLAAIAYLDKLRTCEGEAMPTGLPLACVVRVVGYEEIPKANECYALATVEGWNGQTWRVCVRRYYLEEGMRALFVSYDALLPEDDERFDNLDVCKLHDRVFRFGFGVKERRKIPFVKRNIYHNNCGVLYPLDEFHELVKAKVGDDCSIALHLESAEDLRRKAAAPQPKKKAVFQPKPVKDDFLAKLRLHRKRYGW